ncbi:MAG: MBL fold metallo-hydrolase, partial [Rhodobacteraceae bacterium]|nr:MBL fold metallo-hydrolase [Paracoccaceae bacterium]
VGDFEVIETPGHTMGHLAFFRASDRVLILGDAAMNLTLPLFAPGLRLPLKPVTEDMAAARASLRRLAALRPEVLCFGHGPVLREDGRFAAFVAGLG